MLPLITRQRVLILFLHWVLTLCPFAHRTLRASHSVQFMLQECYVPAPWGQRVHINNLEFFCIGGFLFISHFFIYSFMCGVMDFFMYFWIFMPSIPVTESRTPIKSCTVETLCGPPLHLVSLATSTWLTQVAIRAQSPGESLKYMWFFCFCLNIKWLAVLIYRSMLSFPKFLKHLNRNLTDSWIESRLTALGGGAGGRDWTKKRKKKELTNRDYTVMISGERVDGSARGYRRNKWW